MTAVDPRDADTTRTPPLAVRTAAAIGAVLIAIVLVALCWRVPWTAVPTTLGTDAAQQAIVLSVVTATVAAAIATVLGVPLGWVVARHRRRWTSWARAIVLVPMVLPPVVIGVALLAAFGRRGVIGEAIGLSLPFTTAGVVVAQTVVALPFVVVSIDAAARLGDGRYEEVAAVAGASRWFAFRTVSLPMLGPAVAGAFALAWARALGEFGATITFAGSLEGRTRTLPLAVVAALENDADLALSLSALLLGLSLLLLVGLRGRWLTIR